MMRFLGYDTVRCQPGGWDYPRSNLVADDTAELAKAGGRRSWVDEGFGIIRTMNDFEEYPWPDPDRLDWREMEWYEKNLPDDMAVYALTAHQLEELVWLMGYEGLCMAMFDQPELVDAMAERIESLETEFTRRLVQFDCVRFVWGSDDMGYKTGTMVQPDFIREKVLPCHAECARIAHDAGRTYLLHSCGNLDQIMDDIIDAVKVDAKHSFEDVIRPMSETKRLWGDRIGLIGGVDVDFLCRADEDAIRARVRETLAACLPGGGYVLGTGNSVANYIPPDNYLLMLDEGRRWKM
jgi:uroporphyrinogen decarboxylase